jgi:hypothetical protein
MVAVGDVYELAITWNEASSATQMVNVLHFRQKAGFLSAINLVGEVKAGVETEMRAIVQSGVQLVKYSCTSLIPFATDFYEATYALAGTNGAGVLPMVCAQIITWRTGLPGRRKRGRTYFPAAASSNYSGGRWAALHVTNNMNAVGNKVLSVWGPGGSSATTEFGVWSRVLGNQLPPHDAAGFQIVTSFTSQSAVATMGTRRYGRGI